MSEGSPFLESVDWSLFSRDVLESGNSVLVDWSDERGAEYIGLVFLDDDEYTAGQYTVYEYDLERFKLAAALLDSAEMAVKIIENVKRFLGRLDSRLRGLPGPLAMAKLLNITAALALGLESCSPGTLDKILDTLE